MEEDEDDDDDEDEIALDMEDVEAVSKKARQDEELKTEHVQVRSFVACFNQFNIPISRC